MTEIVTAAMLVIGDEILSGRTKDKNIGVLADQLTEAAINLKQVRIVPDEEDMIVEAVNALRASHDYVFTSGGIGPTHDDITADAIARAFGVECRHDAKAVQILSDSYSVRGLEFTEARKRMARMPVGATHIQNSLTVAPGFSIGNVHVMAGVPLIFQSMLAWLVPQLRKGTLIRSASVTCPFGEGLISQPLAEIQQRHPQTSIGSYPKYHDGSFTTELVIRSRNEVALEAARDEIAQMVERLKAQGQN